DGVACPTRRLAADESRTDHTTALRRRVTSLPAVQTHLTEDRVPHRSAELLTHRRRRGGPPAAGAPWPSVFQNEEARARKIAPGEPTRPFDFVAGLSGQESIFWKSLVTPPGRSVDLQRSRRATHAKSLRRRFSNAPRRGYRPRKRGTGSPHSYRASSELPTTKDVTRNDLPQLFLAAHQHADRIGLLPKVQPHTHGGASAWPRRHSAC